MNKKCELIEPETGLTIQQKVDQMAGQVVDVTLDDTALKILEEKYSTASLPEIVSTDVEHDAIKKELKEIAPVRIAGVKVVDSWLKPINGVRSMMHAVKNDFIGRLAAIEGPRLELNKAYKAEQDRIEDEALHQQELRLNRIKDEKERIGKLPGTLMASTSADVATARQQLVNYGNSPDFCEGNERQSAKAVILINETIASLDNLYKMRLAAEQEEDRKADEEKKRIKRESADKVKFETDQAKLKVAQDKIADAEKELADKAAALENEKKRVADKEQAVADAAQKVEDDKKAAIEAEKQRVIDAENAEKETKEQAEREENQRIADEQERIEQEARDKAEAERKAKKEAEDKLAAELAETKRLAVAKKNLEQAKMDTIKYFEDSESFEILIDEICAGNVPHIEWID